MGSLSKLTKYLLIFGVVVPLLVYKLDTYLLPAKFYTPTPLGIHQQQIPPLTHASPDRQAKLIDPATGALNISGWGVDLEELITVNYEDARPLSNAFPSLNRLQYRTWNYHLLHTPKHVIQFIFVDVVSYNGVGICPSSIVVFDKEAPAQFKKVEFIPCPEHDRHKLFDFERPSYVQSKDGSMHASVTRKEGRTYEIRIREPTKLELEVDLTFDYDSAASSFFAVPMTADGTTYFANLKKSALANTGSYKLKGKEYVCKGDGDCLMMIDNGRTHQTYGIQYFWVLFMTKLADGRLLTVNLCDGLASKYGKLDQSGEDFLVIDRDYYRLDLTRMTSEHPKGNEGMISNKHFVSDNKGEGARFQQNGCDLKFTPVNNGKDAMVEDGVNVVFVAFKQYLVYGYFSGECVVKDHKSEAVIRLPVEKVYGHVEYVYSRW